MASLEDLKSEHLYYMFKGEPGTRKSTAALSFYPFGKQYWFSTDKKMESIKIPFKNWGVPKGIVEYDDYSSWSTIIDKLERLQVNCPYKTLIFDSITSEADTINQQTLKFKSDKKNKEGGVYRIAGIPVNTMEDYKAEASAFQELVTITKDIQSYHGVNIILIAHVIGARKPDDDNNITTFSRIIVTGGQIISAKIPSYCTEIYHFNVEKGFSGDDAGEYGLFTSHTGNDFARTSLPLPRKILFNDKPLYGTYIKPAIDTLNSDGAGF